MRREMASCDAIAEKLRSQELDFITHSQLSYDPTEPMVTTREMKLSGWNEGVTNRERRERINRLACQLKVTVWPCGGWIQSQSGWARYAKLGSCQDSSCAKLKA